MNHARKLTVGLLVLCALAAGGAPVRADSPGPYYATPSWDQTLPSATRFIVLSNFNTAAVLDRETGLVWEKSPDVTNTYTWEDAQFHCNQLQTGNRMGWRLPTIEELASLVEPSQMFPALPSGHPFTNAGSGFRWSASTSASSTSYAWYEDIANGVSFALDKSFPLPAWCVRGGQGVNPQ